MLKSIRNMSSSNKQKMYMGLVSFAILSVFIYKFLYVGLPYFSEIIAGKVPPPIYEVIDSSTLKSMDNDEFSESLHNEQRQSEITVIFDKLVEQQQNTGKKYQVVFRKWDEIPNALALVNGTIVVTDELVSLIDNEEELAAVLLHEIGHVVHNHSMENMIRVSIASIMLSFMFGDISTIGTILVEGASLGVTLTYSRDAELEADEFAIKALKLHYGSVAALESILLKLHGESDVEKSWLSTHPSVDERLKMIQINRD